MNHLQPSLLDERAEVDLWTYLRFYCNPSSFECMLIRVQRNADQRLREQLATTGPLRGVNRESR